MVDDAYPPHHPLDPERAPPPELTRAQFLAWRAPRLGTTNPEHQTNPVWTWLARQPELSAYSAAAHFGGPVPNPGWCGARFGQTTTALPDGRTIAIAGEHEDHYDPDFFIYNDVWVTSPDGSLALYGYPHEVFPPTDFHSATLAGDRIVVIGSLGYARARVPGTTPVYALDTTTLAITALATTGANPGWLSHHSAVLVDDRTVMVTGGKRIVAGRGYPDNHDDYALDLATGTWTRLTARGFVVWHLARADGSRNELFEIDSRVRYPTTDPTRDPDQEARARLGFVPDPALHAARYQPPIPHTARPTDTSGWPPVHCLAVDGVEIRYREEGHHVVVTIAGALPEPTMAAIVEDAQTKLGALEHTPYRATRLED